MIDEIALRRDELRAVCRRFHVRRLDLFGSAARSDFEPATERRRFPGRIRSHTSRRAGAQDVFRTEGSAGGAPGSAGRSGRTGCGAQSVPEGEHRRLARAGLCSVIRKVCCGTRARPPGSSPLLLRARALPTSTVTSSCGRPSSAVRDHRRSACAACAHRCRDGAESADLRQIIAFRNVLIHGYATVDPAHVCE